MAQDCRTSYRLTLFRSFVPSLCNQVGEEENASVLMNALLWSLVEMAASNFKAGNSVILGRLTLVVLFEIQMRSSPSRVFE